MARISNYAPKRLVSGTMQTLIITPFVWFTAIDPWNYDRTIPCFLPIHPGDTQRQISNSTTTFLPDYAHSDSIGSFLSTLLITFSTIPVSQRKIVLPKWKIFATLNFEKRNLINLKFLNIICHREKLPQLFLSIL